MRNFRVWLIPTLLLTALFGVFAPAAQAAPQIVPAAAQSTLAYHVPPITCETETACVIDYYAGTSAPNDGYWMAKRRVGGTIWIRLTSVPGMDNWSAAPITCTQEDSCVQDYYPGNIWISGDYWMARQADGTTWVRETLVNGR